MESVSLVKYPVIAQNYLVDANRHGTSVISAHETPLYGKTLVYTVRYETKGVLQSLERNLVIEGFAKKQPWFLRLFQDKQVSQIPLEEQPRVLAEFRERMADEIKKCTRIRFSD